MNRHIVIFTHQKDIESHEEDTIHIDPTSPKVDLQVKLHWSS